MAVKPKISIVAHIYTAVLFCKCCHLLFWGICKYKHEFSCVSNESDTILHTL